jgi:NADPH-dependent curcumin reductase CurA
MDEQPVPDPGPGQILVKAKWRFKEDVLDGIERMPEAFVQLLSGKNFGKQIIRTV